MLLHIQEDWFFVSQMNQFFTMGSVDETVETYAVPAFSQLIVQIVLVDEIYVGSVRYLDRRVFHELSFNIILDI